MSNSFYCVCGLYIFRRKNFVAYNLQNLETILWAFPETVYNEDAFIKHKGHLESS